MFQIGGTAVTWKSKKAWKSKKQSCVALVQLTSDLCNQPSELFEDNQSAICMAKNLQFHGRSNIKFGVSCVKFERLTKMWGMSNRPSSEMGKELERPELEGPSRLCVGV